MNLTSPDDGFSSTFNKFLSLLKGAITSGLEEAPAYSPIIPSVAPLTIPPLANFGIADIIPRTPAITAGIANHPKGIFAVSAAAELAALAAFAATSVVVVATVVAAPATSAAIETPVDATFCAAA